MSSTPESSELNEVSIETNPEIAFCVLQQIQNLRVENKVKDAEALIREWIV